jgi:glycosyltransferase involved in cell wall biosynthesis
MNILNIIQCTNLGGMEKSSLRLMIELKKRGHSVRLLSLNPIGKLGKLLETHQIPYEGIPYLGKAGWRSFTQLRRKLKSIQADAVIMTGHNLMAMLALSGINLGKRLLAIHFHHTGVKPVWQWRLIYWLAYKKFQAVTFPSDFIRKESEIISPPIASKTYTVRNPLQLPKLPTEEERRNARQVLGIPIDAKVIGNAGWLISRKRFDVFLRVAEKVLIKEPKAIFLIAGDGQDREKLEILAKKLNIMSQVHWLGWQNDLTSFYLSLDALLFNSDWDAFPTTPLEAMSYGLPVIASLLNGGLSEIITEKKFGFLFDKHDIDAMSEAVLSSLDRNSGMNGRARINEICNINTIVDSIEKLIK